jgi:polyribonucleotide nucleotidyltransferase
MSETIIRIESNGIKEEFGLGKVARQASGSVMYRQGKAVIIAAVAVGHKAVEEDFLPLTVQYIEKSYAAAKIPGGYIKRESKPSDFETLTSRIIDRSLRPMFPEGFNYPVTLSVMVVSSDPEVDLQVAALHAANAALLVSEIPIERSVAAVRVGTVDDALTINPLLSQMEESTLDLFVTGSGDDLMMIEMRAIATDRIDDVEYDPMALDGGSSPLPLVLSHQESNAIDEVKLMEAITLATEAIEEASTMYQIELLPLKASRRITVASETLLVEKWVTLIDSKYSDQLDAAIRSAAKSERVEGLRELADTIVDDQKAQEGIDVDRETVKAAVDITKKARVRAAILEEGIRADGRRLDEVRPIDIETNLLPGAHGSCLFTRGQTQALVTATLGDSKGAQMYEMLQSKQTQNERFMVHYNFPGFSVGEAKPIGAPGRRELGHGNLAKRALEPVIDRDLDGSIRLVSEILESNGSSSMATVCGGALALCAAEVEVSDLVAGVAMGLVIEGDRHAVLTDIMGLEDHDGDMDFKVTGTADGITALQMDIKLGGLDPKILSEALTQAREARLHILGIMEEAKEKIQPSGALPSIEHFTINPAKIVDIIGKAGSTIREIIEKFEVAIDLDRDRGGVKVTGQDAGQVTAAKAHIEAIAGAPERKQMQYTLGETYHGTVKKIVDFGLFVEMPDGFDALLHISKVAKGRINDLHDRYSEGDAIDVVDLEQKGRKVELATLEYIA